MRKKILGMFSSALMVLSLFVAMPVKAANTTVRYIDSTEELAEAIATQTEGETWYISAGEYCLTKNDLSKYADIKPGTSGQGNWYFPIIEDGISIIGQGDVTITTDYETQNGVWASQDFISVWGDNVTIDNVDILSKKEQNKAIEVMGKDFTLKNSTIKKVDENGSGSIIFNSQDSAGDIGSAVLENVTLYSWVSTNYSETGTLTADNVTIDFRDNSYAGYYDEAYGYGWCPGIFNSSSNVKVNNTDMTILVDSNIDLNGQIFNDKL